MTEIKQNEITKYIVISSDIVLPADATMKIYESEYPVTVKETCFGLIVTGPEKDVLAVVEKIRQLDKNHIFIKDRGFPAGDERRCRATRGGGPRPGFHFLREEVEMLPAIGAALDELDAKGAVNEKHGEKRRLKVSDLEKIIEAELSR
ncbi:putative methanogenesis marker protein 6 [Methanosarcina siciliae C2J]|uniref:Putative methanogenesis marker protein 6 n=3 Tax=Methanosarcina siciliae TaxID=38027 RepID=A0A0E3LBL0_9EURY|nr:methanogenesis marker 6 protein [Methanosarcina siciliae]AKB30056.1 putative methanogenesis marker protein 6 [Methanosarcina siciliae T4/M]AKB33956.1 putative methanogenesis marker protein 6 [Methanosarcina siciliae HI350]AKB38320.1 putative methanogenesis marker protein 6 [Methanosarcina siciliae C2J]